jgi:hypothetical protein
VSPSQFRPMTRFQSQMIVVCCSSSWRCSTGDDDRGCIPHFRITVYNASSFNALETWRGDLRSYNDQPRRHAGLVQVWLLGSFHRFFQVPNVIHSFFEGRDPEAKNDWFGCHPTARHHPFNRTIALTCLALVLLVCNSDDDDDDNMKLCVV